jgi:hypothetical protein
MKELKKHIIGLNSDRKSEFSFCLDIKIHDTQKSSVCGEIMFDFPKL